MVSLIDHVGISVDALMINSGCSLKKELFELIRINPWIVLCQIFYHVDSCHDCLRDPLTWDTKDILWTDDHVLIMTYKSLALGFLKRHRLDTTWSSWRWLSAWILSKWLISSFLSSSWCFSCTQNGRKKRFYHDRESCSQQQDRCIPRYVEWH